MVRLRVIELPLTTDELFTLITEPSAVVNDAVTALPDVVVEAVVVLAIEDATRPVVARVPLVRACAVVSRLSVALAF